MRKLKLHWNGELWKIQQHCTNCGQNGAYIGRDVLLVGLSVWLVTDAHCG